MTLRMPWITATGQRWKIYVFFCLLVAMLLLITSSFEPAIAHLLLLGDSDMLVLVSAVTAALSISWLAFAVRCPRCQCRIGLWYMTNRRPSEFFTDFVATTECPCCSQHEGANYP